MSWYFSWAGIKRDQRGKNHIYGWIVRYDSDLDKNRHYRIHGMVSGDKPFIHMIEYFPFYESFSRAYVGGKLRAGYKEYKTEHIKRSLPLVIDEIEGQWMIERLKR